MYGLWDNDNDVEMMKQMKYSYGMRSGSEALKRVVYALGDHPSEILEQLIAVL